MQKELTLKDSYVGVRKVQKNALAARIRRIDRLTDHEIGRMHALFSQYYEEHPREKFEADLREKNHVILLKDKQSGRVQGFSTLLKIKIPTERGVVNGIYSGDTVVAQEYWGSAALQLTFLKYICIEKLKNPFQPLIWFLISKGYKTYLLMANNFNCHYPRFEQPTPEFYQKIMQSFYGSKFAGTYQHENGLIVPEGTRCRLKTHVAQITPELLVKNKRVAFFQKMNPNWSEGVELTCIAEMKLSTPFTYTFKKIYQKLVK